MPAKMMSNLAQLCLVCFQYCTTHGSCTEGLSGDSSTSKRLLFDAVVQLLLTEPEIIKDMLSLLLTIVSGKGERVIREQLGVNRLNSRKVMPLLSFEANFSFFSLAESPPRDLQITTYK